MWSPDRRVLILGLLALPACGFTPAYAPGGTGTVLDGQVAVSAPDTGLGYRTRDRLERRLGLPQGSPRFALAVTPTAERTAAAFTEDGLQSRANLIGVSRYRLVDTATGAALATGTVDAFTGFATAGSTVASRAAERDAEERLAVMLADLIMTRLLALPPPG
jgi:LPS-assembly lipoprotein